MGNAELKLDIFRIVDQLSESELQKLYSMVNDLVNVNASSATSPWDRLSKAEQAAIEEGLSQIEQGKVKPHEEVMANFRKKYSQ